MKENQNLETLSEKVFRLRKEIEKALMSDEKTLKLTDKEKDSQAKLQKLVDSLDFSDLE